MKRKFYKKSDIGTLTRLFVGAGIALGVLMAVVAIFSAIAMLFEDVAALIPPFAMATVVVSAILGGGIVTRTVAEGKITLALLSSLMAALVMMLIGVIIGGGALPFSVFLNFMIFVGAFVLAAYLLKRREKLGRHIK